MRGEKMIRKHDPKEHERYIRVPKAQSLRQTWEWRHTVGKHLVTRPPTSCALTIWTMKGEAQVRCQLGGRHVVNSLT